MEWRREFKLNDTAPIFGWPSARVNSETLPISILEFKNRRLIGHAFIIGPPLKGARELFRCGTNRQVSGILPPYRGTLGSLELLLGWALFTQFTHTMSFDTSTT